jgi:sodium/bile acid cotransporter 7
MDWLYRQWFLMVLAVVLTVGLSMHAQLATIAAWVPRGWLVATVMFLTALPLPAGDFARVVRSPLPLVLALLLSMVAAPLAAHSVRGLLPAELSVGLLVAATVPCTLASAAVWTRRGGGSDALALAVTLVTNLACFVVMPLTLAMLLSADIAFDQSPRQLSRQLAERVLLPIAVAQLLRVVPRVARWSAVAKPALSLVCQWGILTMVFVGSIGAGAKLATLDQQLAPAIWLLLLAMVWGLHLTLFAAGWWGAQSLGVSRADAVAVAVSGSQKTLMIGLDVAIAFGGLAVLPMIAYHVVQLLIDTVLVDMIRARQPPLVANDRL